MKCNVLIIGGGILGSSTAFHLAQRGVSEVVVVDLEMSRATFSSTTTNAGGVRATWWQPLNIELSLESIRYYAEHADSLGFRRLGYLWLYADADSWEQALHYRGVQRDLGVDVQLLGPREVEQGWPHLSGEGLIGATWSPGDGLISPYEVWQHYVRGARDGGVRFLNHHYVCAAETSGSEYKRIQSVEAQDFSEEVGQYSDDAFIKDVLMSHDWSRIRGRRVRIEPDIVVNAAGAWAPVVSERLGAQRTTRARRRMIVTFAGQSPPGGELVRNAATGEPYGMIVDPSGVYFHPEGPLVLAGYSPPDEPTGYEFTPGSEDFFLRFIYEPLSRRFATPRTPEVRLRMKSSWSGLYSYSPDISLVMGPVKSHRNLFEIHSDTGKGVMHSYAAGRALAGRIVDGRFADERHEIFAWERFASLPEDQWLHETLHI